MAEYLSRPVEILMVDDDDVDAGLVRDALKGLPLGHSFNWVPGGEEALAYLRGQGPYAGALRPDLVILDLNMPGMDGRQVLREIKSDADLKTIPVVIMTTSEHWEDIRDSFANYCNGYLTKPYGWQELKQMMNALNNYWFSLVRLPPHPDGNTLTGADTSKAPFQTKGCHVKVLLVDDDPDFAGIVARAAKDLGFSNPIGVAGSGEAALEMLRDGATEKPDLILLDLVLPGAGGRETLSEIKNDPNLKGIQVVAFTGTDSEDVALDLYRAHANAFVLKPGNLTDLEQVFATIAYWYSFAHVAKEAD